MITTTADTVANISDALAAANEAVGLPADQKLQVHCLSDGWRVIRHYRTPEGVLMPRIMISGIRDAQTVATFLSFIQLGATLRWAADINRQKDSRVVLPGEKL